MALGDCLAALGYKYDSEEALLFIEQMMHIKMEAELDCTIDLAILRGPFLLVNLFLAQGMGLGKSGFSFFND